MKYRPDIDGLRAVAVTAVILFHAFPGLLPGGFVGVDIFFVISGYLITGIIVEELDKGTFSIASFYQRRIRRIFPSLIVVLAATLYVGWNWLLPNELASLGKNTVASALFSANLMLLSEVNYFDISAHSKPLLHLWSLGIEEQFYLAWPLLLTLLPRRRFTLVVILGLVASFALNVFLLRHHPAATFFLPVTRAWELLGGASLTFLPTPSRPMRQLYGAAGAILVGASMVLLKDSTPFPGWAALLPVAGTGLLIASEDRAVNRILSFKPLVGIGLISYPLYLWHWPVLVYLQTCLFRPPTPAELLGAIAATFALALVTYLAVERPIRRRRLALPLAGVMAAVGALAVFPALGYAPNGLPKQIQTVLDVPPNGMGWRVHECMLLDGDAGDFKTCTDDKRPLVAIWGDSTASALIPSFRSLQHDGHGFGVAQYTVSSCPPLFVRVHTMSDYCLSKNAEIVRKIASVKPDIVVLHAIWDVNDSIAGTKPTIDALRAAGVGRIVIVGPVPVWPGGLPNAVLTYFRRTQTLIPEQTSEFVDQVSGDQLMGQIAHDLGVEYVSARSVFCNGNECRSRIGDRVAASDLLHLTKPAADLLVMTVASRLGLN
jgi:peptidoglycan/LPS O-acetylase OafA/YrhL